MGPDVGDVVGRVILRNGFRTLNLIHPMDVCSSDIRAAP